MFESMPVHMCMPAHTSNSCTRQGQEWRPNAIGLVDGDGYVRSMEIRPFTDTDSDAVIELWRLSGLVQPANDPRRDIERKTSDSPWGFLVAVDDAAIVGSVMVGYDGHRGWINYLACRPEHRRSGVASQLMAAARELLLDRGCPKINLQVRSGNTGARMFYESLGYSEDSVTSFGLRLIFDR